MTKHQYFLHSHSLASVIYSESEDVLEIHFRQGEIYRYFMVPHHVVQELLGAESPGEYFRARIRLNYPYKRVS